MTACRLLFVFWFLWRYFIRGSGKIHFLLFWLNASISHNQQESRKFLEVESFSICSTKWNNFLYAAVKISISRYLRVIYADINNTNKPSQNHHLNNFFSWRHNILFLQRNSNQSHYEHQEKYVYERNVLKGGYAIKYIFRIVNFMMAFYWKMIFHKKFKHSYFLM